MIFISNSVDPCVNINTQGSFGSVNREEEFECPDNFYKLDDNEQRELVIEAIKPKKIFFLE